LDFFFAFLRKNRYTFGEAFLAPNKRLLPFEMDGVASPKKVEFDTFDIWLLKNPAFYNLLKLIIG
jgi:hypothetical protein